MLFWKNFYHHTEMDENSLVTQAIKMLGKKNNDLLAKNILKRV